MMFWSGFVVGIAVAIAIGALVVVIWDELAQTDMRP